MRSEAGDPLIDQATILLTTERLRLLPASREDAEEMWPHLSDPKISEHMSWLPHPDMQTTLEFLERVERGWRTGSSLTWTIREKGSNGFCGIFSLIAILRTHRALTYNRAELAYWCARSWQGKGIMSEAGCEVIRFAFEAIDLNRLVVSHHVGNPASERLILRLGFQLIGTEHEAFRKHGRWIDTRFYELLRRDWGDDAASTSVAHE